MRYESILETIGNTPLIRINRLAEGLSPRIYAKAEYFNPGGSVKDRIGIAMIEEAEKKGILKPGGTIIEGTSGNTGIGLALAASLKGYKVIFTITDKQSREKINFMKSLGAEVIVCPTAVEPEDPRSYYSVAAKLAKEIPNAFYPNQYENQANPRAHYRATGPEIWEDTEGQITHFVAGMGTGGTITGTGRYLKEKNPKIKIIGVDPIGSLFYEKFHHNRVGHAKTYAVEGIGEDIFPTTLDFKVLDDIVQATDKDSFVMTRKLARMEGLYTGGSGGSAVWAALQLAKKLKPSDFIVVLLPDTGMRYLSKIYNDDWMDEHNYTEEIPLSVADILRTKAGKSRGGLVMAEPKQSLWDVLKLMRAKDISQIPIFERNRPIGTLQENEMLALLLKGTSLKKMIVREAMGKALPIFPPTARLEELSAAMGPQGSSAVLVRKGTGPAAKAYDIVTKYDVLRAVSLQAQNGSPKLGSRRAS